MVHNSPWEDWTSDEWQIFYVVSATIMCGVGMTPFFKEGQHLCTKFDPLDDF